MLTKLHPWSKSQSSIKSNDGKYNDVSDDVSLSQSRTGGGGLIVVGSYVPKTTAQLYHLLASSVVMEIPLDASEIIRACKARRSGSNSVGSVSTIDALVGDAVATIDEALSKGRDVVLYTSREFSSGADLSDTAYVSDVVTRIVSSLSSRPKYVISKGGITSFDVAKTGLGVRSARVLGQVEPGVPVWQLDQQSKFPGVPYIVFPGNVGNEDALTRVAQKLGTRARPTTNAGSVAVAVGGLSTNELNNKKSVEPLRVSGSQATQHGSLGIASGLNTQKWSSAVFDSKWTGRAGIVSALLEARANKRAIAAFNICKHNIIILTV